MRLDVHWNSSDNEEMEKLSSGAWEYSFDQPVKRYEPFNPSNSYDSQLMCDFSKLVTEPASIWYGDWYIYPCMLAGISSPKSAMYQYCFRTIAVPNVDLNESPRQFQTSSLVYYLVFRSNIYLHVKFVVSSASESWIL